jgi:hypothetical protein
LLDATDIYYLFKVSILTSPILLLFLLLLLLLLLPPPLLLVQGIKMIRCFFKKNWYCKHAVIFLLLH